MAEKYTPAQAAASKKYINKLDSITIRVPKGAKEEYKKLAKDANMSLNQFIIHCVEEHTRKPSDTVSQGREE